MTNFRRLLVRRPVQPGKPVRVARALAARHSRMAGLWRVGRVQLVVFPLRRVPLLTSGSRLGSSRLANRLPPDATRAVSGVVSARECEARENLRRWSPPKSRGRGTDTSSDLGANSPGVAMFGGEMIVGGRIIVSLTAGLSVDAPPLGRTYAQESGSHAALVRRGYWLLSG